MLALVGHRVTRTDRDRSRLVDQRGAVTAAELDCFLAKNAQRFVGLEALTEGAEDGSLLLTFDDGYIDVRETVLPLLERHRIPALVFVTTGFVEGSEPQMERALSYLVEREAVEDLSGSVLPTRTSEQRWAVYERLRSYLKMMPPTTRRRSLLELFERNQLPLPKQSVFLSWEHVGELARHPFTEIHAHSVSHPVLTVCPMDIVEAEIRDSRQILARHAGTTVSAFSYPYGAFDGRVARTVRRAKYRFAFTTEPRRFPSTPVRGRARFRIPRYDLAHAVMGHV
jgi:peptidoglycan/xylan/chitin deacetylase (PgdA/CDA1 family)